MKAIISFALSVLLMTSSMAHAEITILTSPAPPYVSEDGKSGIAIEIIEELFKRSNLTYNFKTMPLARALVQSANKTNVCVLPVQRSQERETTYKWISPILVTQSALFSLKDSKLDLSVLIDAKEMKIGVLRGGDEEEYLKGFGYSKVQEANDELNNAKKIGSNRIELWATDTILGPYYAKKAGTTIRQQIAFRSTLRALACHISTPDETVDLLTTQLKAMYRDGTVKRIFTEYTKDLEIGDLGEFLN